MGNNITIYDPPSPPTHLSPDKYFWINGADIGRSSGGDNTSDSDGNGSTSSSSSPDINNASSASGATSRDIPVVYITASDKSRHKKNSAGDECDGPCRRRTLLYCHGHDVDLGLTYDLLVHMSGLLGVDVMSFDYAGYGLSKFGRQQDEADKDENNSLGELTEQSSVTNATTVRQLELPSEEQCYDDILTCFDYLVKRKGVLPQNIVLYGKSLGSGPVCWLANKLCREATARAKRDEKHGDDSADEAATSSLQKNTPIKLRRCPTPLPGSFRRWKATDVPPAPPPLGGIVLHSAFLSMLRLRVGFTMGWGTSDPFDNVARLEEMHSLSRFEDGPGYDLPIYFIHGRDDKTVPFGHGEALCRLMLERRGRGFPPFWADGGTHWNVEQKYATAYIKRLQQFLRHCDKVNNNGDDNNASGKGVNPRGRPMSRPRAAIARTNENVTGPAASRDFGSADVPYSPSHDKQGDRSILRMGRVQMNVHLQRAGGRGRTLGHHRPSNTAMTHHRARSSSRARQRKKKGTLVMRGVHEDDDEEVSIMVGGERAMKIGESDNVVTSGGRRSSGGSRSCESRDPASIVRTC